MKRTTRRIPLTLKDNSLRICAMSKVCAHINCAHKLTHSHEHMRCFTSYSENKDCTAYCVNFKLKPQYKAITYLVTEKSQTYLKSARLKYGFCIPYDYWKKHFVNGTHVLVGDHSVDDLTREKDRIYRELFESLYEESNKSWVTMTYRPSTATLRSLREEVRSWRTR